MSLTDEAMLKLNEHEKICSERYHGIQNELADGRRRMERLETAQLRNNADTAEILEIMVMGKAFFKFCSYFGKFVKWLTPIALALAGAWHFFFGPSNPVK